MLLNTSLFLPIIGPPRHRRSGYDLDDMYALDLATLEWSEVKTANKPPSPK